MSSRPVSYVDPAATDLVIHRMPGHHIRRLQQVAVRLFAEEVGAELTPVQFAALAAAVSSPGLDQAALSATIGYDRATIGGVIDRLEARGWLARSESDQDRRVRLVRATPAGRRAYEQALAAVERVQQRLLEPLGEADRARFEKLCLKLLSHHLG